MGCQIMKQLVFRPQTREPIEPRRGSVILRSPTKSNDIIISSLISWTVLATLRFNLAQGTRTKKVQSCIEARESAAKFLPMRTYLTGVQWLENA